MISGIWPRLEELHRKVDKILESIINEDKVRDPTAKTGGEGEAEDLVHVLSELQEHGNLEFPLTTNSIKAVILVISKSIIFVWGRQIFVQA